MKRWNILHVNFTCILYALVCCPILAQTSWKAEHCRVLASASEPAGPKVILDDIVLGRPTDVVAPVWDQIVSETKRQVFSGGNWVEELKEVTLRGALQNQGYFTPDVAAEAKVVSSSPTLEHVVVQAQ